MSFFYLTFTIHGAGGGGGGGGNSNLSLTFAPAWRVHWDITRTITAESLILNIASERTQTRNLLLFLSSLLLSHT